MHGPSTLLPAAAGAISLLGVQAKPPPLEVWLRAPHLGAGRAGPRRGTFYSADVLNPDVVRVRHRYHPYFSGNDVKSASGRWFTGLAVASRPEGPFRVVRRVRLPFLNGGTTYDGKRYLQGATDNGRLGTGLVIFRSRDGRSFRLWRLLPEHGSRPGWRRWQSDLYLVSRPVGFDVYYAGRPGPSGADLGIGSYRNGRWSNFARILERLPGSWDGLDLGEPPVFHVRGNSYMLYAGLGHHGGSRQIGLAHRTRHRCERCGIDPFIPVGGRNAAKNTIDPEPLVVGKRLNEYFAGGRTASPGGNMSGVIRVRTSRLPS